MGAAACTGKTLRNDHVLLNPITAEGFFRANNHKGLRQTGLKGCRSSAPPVPRITSTCVDVILTARILCNLNDSYKVQCIFAERDATVAQYNTVTLLTCVGVSTLAARGETRAAAACGFRTGSSLSKRRVFRHNTPRFAASIPCEIRGATTRGSFITGY